MENIDFAKLPKKERKRLKRELEHREAEKKAGRGALVKVALLTGFIIAIGLIILWAIGEGGKPLAGQKLEDQGRTHVPKEQWEKFSYNSNPPASGPHDATWTKAGIYDNPQGDGYLIHALEHGYVVISYNCSQKSKLKSQNSKLQLKTENFLAAFAHETEEVHEEPMATKSAESSSSAGLKGDAWDSDECKQLKKQISDLAEEKKLWKLVVVPRPTLDVSIALTAWARIFKLDKFDKEEISKFIDSFRNRGPEATPD